MRDVFGDGNYGGVYQKPDSGYAGSLGNRRGRNRALMAEGWD